MADSPKHVHFVLPFRGRKPVGGFKVVYEYANHFAEMGYQVSLTHPAGLYLGVNPNDRLLINIAKFILFGVSGRYLPTPWFKLHPSIKSRWVPSLHPIYAIPADVVFATAWETAEWVTRYPASAGSKHYLIQHLEDWGAPKERVLDTWRLPLKKIVISKWLQSQAEDLGESATYIPNGLDHRAFGLDVAPEERNPLRVLMLYHTLPFKGTAIGLEALETVKGTYPDLEVTLFGVDMPEEHHLPSWIHFECRPSQRRLRELYNQSSIFMSPSFAEGWALPPAEAMMCGCATILTDIGGHEYALNGSTSLLAPPHDAASLADHLISLIKAPQLRIRLAKAGAVEMKKYDWQTASSALEKTINEP